MYDLFCLWTEDVREQRWNVSRCDPRKPLIVREDPDRGTVLAAETETRRLHRKHRRVEHVALVEPLSGSRQDGLSIGVGTAGETVPIVCADEEVRGDVAIADVSSSTAHGNAG